MRTRFDINTSYFSVISFTFYLIFNAAIGYASMYLSRIGLTPLQIGIFLCISTIISGVLQIILGQHLDNNVGASIRKVIIVCSLIIFVSAICERVFFHLDYVLIALYLIIVLLVQLVMSLFNAWGMKIKDNSARSLKYSIARGFGSLGFAVSASVIGYFADKIDVTYFPIAFAIVTAVFIMLCTFAQKAIPDNSYIKPYNENQNKNKNLTRADFAVLKKNKIFVAFLVAAFLLYLGDNCVGLYLYQIVENVGGAAQDYGSILSVAAIIEIPAMFCVPFFVKKFGEKKLLKVSALCFLLKSIFLILAPNVAFVFLSQLFQFGAFGFFAPCSVLFVNYIIDERFKVTGQMYLGICFSLSMVFSSLFGGLILNFFGAPVCVLLSILNILVGGIICIFCCRD